MPIPAEFRKDLVSVIVTSYNHSEYLLERMESLLSQSYNNLEIIVIDDCSTDNSLQVLNKYRNHSLIKIFALKKNEGYANACNLGVSFSSGEFIMFAECDDYSDVDHIRVLLNRINKDENIGVSFCRSRIVDSDGTLIRDDFNCREGSFKALCAKDTGIPKKEMQRFLLRSCVIPNMSAALIRKNFFQMAGGLSPAYKACADWDFWCRIAMVCDFYYVPLPLNNFRTHDTSVRSTYGIQRQVCEMFDLLYAAIARMQPTLKEQFHFGVGLGNIWAGQFSSSPINWIRCFPLIWRHSLRHTKISLLYLCLAVGKTVAKKLFLPR